MEIRAIVDCKNSLGEGPLWDVQERKIYWIDSLRAKVFRANADGSGVESWDVPAKIGSMAIRRNGGAILSLQNGFHAFDFKTGKATLIADPEADNPRTRINDGKVDRKGRFIAGSMDTKETDPIGALYRLDPDLSVHKLLDGIIVSNGPCWSPDDRTFYFADSWSGEMGAFDWNAETGTPSNRRTFARYDKAKRETGVFDGSTVDAEGYVWNAAVFSGELRRFAPDGRLDRAITMPVKNITSLIFGGPDLDIIYVTSIGQIHLPGLPNDGPLGGGLFAVKGAGVKGLPEPRFAG
ncbi:MAG: SMP-30/gluconolactonase/LRE family protein [Dongiaceae bacterium]